MKTLPDLLSEQFIQAFQKAEKRTGEIFGLIHADAYYERPIPLRHPIVFYEGHLEAFIWNALFRRTLGRGVLNAHFDQLFERGIDPGDKTAAEALTITQWPSREEILTYKYQVRQQLYGYLRNTDLTAAQNAKVRNVLYLILEHEQMHQETLLYILHQLPYHLKRKPESLPVPDFGPAPEARLVDIPAGIAFLGASGGEFDFGWDNEFQQHEVQVGAFAMDAYHVTNDQFLEFTEAGGYETREYWDETGWQWIMEENIRHPFFWQKGGRQWFLRDFFELIPLPMSWPVNVTQVEASAYARFKGLDLPTEAEWHRAAFGEHQSDPYPWGHDAPSAEHGNFNFARWSYVRVGAYPLGVSRYGIHDLYGQGWEWTSTVFAPFPGFTPSEAYPVYSADFFDGKHYVMKGGSCFTDKRLLRRSFRNWFYGNYPYMYASFRCVKRAS